MFKELIGKMVTIRVQLDEWQIDGATVPKNYKMQLLEVNTMNGETFLKCGIKTVKSNKRGAMEKIEYKYFNTRYVSIITVEE